MTRRAAIYVRISEDRNDTGQKVQDQETDCRALAERMGLDVVEVFEDNDISAMRSSRGKRKRARWYDLLDAIRAGLVDVVLATEPERVQRETRDLLDYIDVCQARGVPTVTVRGGDFDLSTSDGRMTAKIITATKEAEAEKVRERMRAARVHKARRGEWTGNRRPFGFEGDGVTVRRVEADAVRWACGQVLQGMSLSATAKALNTKMIFSSTGRPWDARTLGRMLLRARNAGLSIHKGVVVGQAQWPALVSETMWRGVVAVLEDESRRTAPGGPPRWLGTNLYRCHCGELVVSKGRVRPKMTVYACTAGAHLSRNAVEVDAFVRDVVLGVLVAKGKALLVPEGAHERMAELNARDAELAGTLRRLGDALAEGRMDFQTVEQATARIRTERAGITDELTDMAAGSVLSGVADAADVAKAYDACDLSRRRAIVDLLMVVTLKRSRRGRPRGWESGGSYFDPSSVEFTPK
jgi:DNA invertase Pin-like site-specific DNA recombinase